MDMLLLLLKIIIKILKWIEDVSGEIDTNDLINKKEYWQNDKLMNWLIAEISNTDCCGKLEFNDLYIVSSV